MFVVADVIVMVMKEIHSVLYNTSSPRLFTVVFCQLVLQLTDKINLANEK